MLTVRAPRNRFTAKVGHPATQPTKSYLFDRIAGRSMKS